jgi:hypothetical protein
MTEDRLRLVFEAALRRDPEERETFLEMECAGDEDLRQAVASLLAGRNDSSDFILRRSTGTTRLSANDSTQTFDGRVVGPYIIRHEIGRGGMGVVFLAEDTRLARRVALKALVPQVGREPGRRERLRQEARAAAGLSHPGIATVYALEEIDTELYLACEYVAGQTLRKILKSGRLPLREVLDIALQLAEGLRAAHASGIVHRDLKPENVIRTSTGVVKILDFGIARVEDRASADLTQPGVIVGTPAYMSPEQTRGEEVDFRTDLFSFGVLVYEMTSGSNPFLAGSLTATIARIVEVNPPPLSHVIPSGSAQLDRIVERCLKKHPSERYKSTQELVADLELLRSPTAGAAPAVSDRRVVTPRQWWELQQLGVSAVYVTMMYPAWVARSWLPAPWGMAMMFGVLSCAALATSLRLHLWFTSRFASADLAIQRAQTSRWIRWCDIGFVCIELVTSIAVAGAHPAVATLLITVALGTAVSALVHEPAKAAAAFRADGEGR